MKLKSTGSSKGGGQSRLKVKIVQKKIAPWRRAPQQLPFQPAHFTAEQIKEAVDAVAA